jgi:cellulose synthase/poly-beta-1,6-N-acetylglucosamine synthase-like glycosyltransferase
VIFRFIEISNDTLFTYYLLSNLIYVVLLIAAVWTSTVHRRHIAGMRLTRMMTSPLTPPVALLVPARNEEKSIVEAVHSLLELDYPGLEVIVINDGSTDRTLEELIEKFHLLETDLFYVPEIPTQIVRRIYVSQDDGRLLVLDKEWGHSKADCINAGVNAASSPYICVVDADAVLEKDALLRIMIPSLTEVHPVVASGGIVRVVNGCVVVGGQLREVRLPHRPLEILQVIEYLRAFLVGREGWAHFNLLMIISGAFGVFRRDLVKQVGGYRTDTVGEDIDLVTRLHRLLQERKQPYRINFVPDPVCWTEAPSDVRSLGRQRARWQKGLFDVLWRNRDMLFNPRYGRIGWLALPYLWIFELLAPVIELLGYTTIIAAALLGVLSRHFLFDFLLFGYAFATVISIGSVLQEEITYRRYNDWRDVTTLILFCLLEHFPYRQLQMFWRFRGLWQYLRGDWGWGQLQRMGFQSRAETK